MHSNCVLGLFCTFFLQFREQMPVKNLHQCTTNEKALGETQTLGAGCSKGKPKTFDPPQTPFPGAQGAKI